MTDPYNSWTSQPPADPVAPTPAARPRRDAIAALDVSAKWKARFRAIASAGGPDLPNARDLPIAERRLALFNWVAFFIGPFYYVALGLWRQTVVYLLVAIACVLVMEAMGLGRFGRAVGYGVCAVFAIRANVSYYRKRVLGETPWV